VRHRSEFEMTPPRNPRNSPSEQADEPPGLIEREEVEIESDIPAEDNQSVERIDPDDSKPETPAFEE